MRIVMFYHSIVSDWNHGNAHFLRGIVTELMARGHRVTVHEPRNGWSFSNLMREKGESVLRRVKKIYPHLQGAPYDLEGWTSTGCCAQRTWSSFTNGMSTNWCG